MGPLCLDLGTKTGYALRVGKAVSIGTADFQPRRGEGAGMRYVRFRRWLTETYRAQPFGLIYYEQVVGISPRAGQAAQQQTYGGLLATMMTWCEDNGIPYGGIPVPTIKKFATGKGNANKEAMIAAAMQALAGDIRADRSKVEDNAADAYNLLRLTESPAFAP